MDPFAKPAEVARPKFFQSSNGDLVEVTDSLIEACYTVKCLISGRGRMLFKNSLGGVFIYENNQVIHQKEQKIMATLLQNDAERLIVYIHEVRTPILRRLLDFIAYHQQDITERERKAWNATFIEQCSQILCELASAAYYLDHKPLVNLTSKAIASQISGKSTEELREALGTQNEPPMPASMTSHLPARFRLQAKVDSRKQRQKLALQNGTALPTIEAPPPAAVVPDTRTVEEVLAFLGEDVSKSSGSKKGKGKKSKGSKAANPPNPTQSSVNTNTNTKSNLTTTERKDEKTEQGGESKKIESNTSEAPAVGVVAQSGATKKEDEECLPLNATVELKVEHSMKVPLNLSASSASSTHSYGSDHSASSSASSSTTTSTQCPLCPVSCNCESALDISIGSSVSPQGPPGLFFPQSQQHDSPQPYHHAGAGEAQSKQTTSLLPALTFPSPFSQPQASLSSSLGIPSTPTTSSSMRHSAPSSSLQAPVQQVGHGHQIQGSLPPFTTPSSTNSTHTLAANPFMMPPMSLATPPGLSVPHMTFIPTTQPQQLLMPQMNSTWDLPPGLSFPSSGTSNSAPVIPKRANGDTAPTGFGPTVTSVSFSEFSTSHSRVNTSSNMASTLPSSAIPSMWEPSKHAALAHLTKFEDDTDSLPSLSSITMGEQYWDDQEFAEDPDFEQELAQFRQSLEMGIRDSGMQKIGSLRSSASSNASSSSSALHLSSDHHSVSSGHRPVGAC